MPSPKNISTTTDKLQDYAVHFEDNTTKITIKKVKSEKIVDQVDCVNNEKRRRSGGLNSSGEGSPKFNRPQRKKNRYDEHQQKIYDEFQPWVLEAYGDAAKTKTITLKKLNRIINALNGKESNRPDSSKFRFWVKTKGFTTEKPKDFLNMAHDETQCNFPAVYVLQMSDTGIHSYRQVAVVEHFFDIIYQVHVTLGSKRCGRHAGQKRTYRTITETYAFLPREAVSKFLSLCSECKNNQGTPSRARKMADANAKGNVVDWEEKINLAQSQPLYKPYESNNNTALNAGVTPELFTYYQLLKTFYDANVPTSGSEPISERSKNFNISNLIQPTASAACAAVDLTKNQNLVQQQGGNSSNNNNININIEGDAKSETNTNLMSVDVSINVSKGSCDDTINELKISCKTTPPKKRYTATSSSFDAEVKAVEAVRMVHGDEGRKDGQSELGSTYLQMTRSMGLADDDALNLESIGSSQQNDTELRSAADDAFMKDADKLKLMLLAWNYQNSAAVQNGTEGPDFATMSALWAQYQNALAVATVSGGKQPPSHRSLDESATSATDTTIDESSTGGGEQKEDDDSEDDSEDKMEPTVPHDPERLKAFNMFVRLFVDENLDRMIPISKQPKEKIQAILDSCTRQFPEFSERARKRIRTYLKSCRRNKRTRDGWENMTRPTPAHLTSVQAEQILALACENESLNAKRMRMGLEPLGQNTDSSTITAPVILGGRRSPSDADTVSVPTPANIAKISPISGGGGGGSSGNNNINNASSSNIPLISTQQQQQPSTEVAATSSSSSSFKQEAPQQGSCYGTMFPVNSVMGVSPTAPTDLSLKRPVFPHKLSPSEIAAVKQLITGYRESAAFLLRSADELEQLLLQQ